MDRGGLTVLLGEEVQDVCHIGTAAQTFPKLGIRKTLSELRQQLQVFFCALFRHQQEKSQIDWAMIRRIEGHGLAQSVEHAGNLTQTFNPAMWNADTLPQSCGSELFTHLQAIKDGIAVHAQALAECGSSLFEQRFLGGGLRCEDNSVLSQ